MSQPAEPRQQARVLITTRMSPAGVRALDEIAARVGTTRSALIRQACKDFLSQAAEGTPAP